MAVGIISPSHNFGKTTCARILKGQFAHPLPAPGLFLPWQDTMPAAREICAAHTAILRHQINVMSFLGPVPGYERHPSRRRHGSCISFFPPGSRYRSSSSRRHRVGCKTGSRRFQDLTMPCVHWSRWSEREKRENAESAPLHPDPGIPPSWCLLSTTPWLLLVLCFPATLLGLGNFLLPLAGRKTGEEETVLGQQGG